MMVSPGGSLSALILAQTLSVMIERDIAVGGGSRGKCLLLGNASVVRLESRRFPANATVQASNHPAGRKHIPLGESMTDWRLEGW